MTIWIDAQLSPSLAKWIKENFGFDAVAVRDLALREASDLEIFQAAREANATVLTKDVDFSCLLSRHGPPPKVIWLTCGNTSNKSLHLILSNNLNLAIGMLDQGESLVEIAG